KSPTGTPSLPSPPDPDHFDCYKVKATAGTTRFEPVIALGTEDQFGLREVDVKKPSRLCLPANVRGANPSAVAHTNVLMCYRTKASLPVPSTVFVNNEVGTGELQLKGVAELCVPSTLISSGGAG